MPKMILLIEDNQNDIDLTTRAFQKSQIHNELIVKEDGQDAIDFLFGTKKNPGAVENDLPALIMLDLKLPRINGLEVLRQIRMDARTRRIPVVVLSTSFEEKDVTAAYDLGASSYIRKPVDFKVFAEVMKNMSLYWLVINEPAPQWTQS